MMVDDLPFPLGSYDVGKDADGTLRAHEFLGRKYCMPDFVDTAGPYKPKYRSTGRQVMAVAVRNTSGGALLPTTVCRFEQVAASANPAGDGLIPVLEAVAGAPTGVADLQCAIVDPYLPAAGVPDDGIFWAIVEGPTIALLPGSGNWVDTTIITGQWLVSSAGTYINAIVVGTDDPLAALGYALEAKASAADDDGTIRIMMCARV